MLKGKNILLGITGSIAAYKSATLVRELVKRGANVKVVMTPLAKEFITPLTLATLAKNPVPVDFFDPTSGSWNSHVSLGLWADAFLIAPATANTLGKMANGIADNLLLTSYFSARCPVLVAPAMDVDMWAHPATQRNLSTLISFGTHVIEPAAGELASGLDGKGRMEEPEMIVRHLEHVFARKQSLTDKTILVTAGPTYEKIDPVRFIGNYSSGKMGFALAETCAQRGAEVILIAGPTDLMTKNAHIRRVDVESAEEMYAQAVKYFPGSDAAILNAAVADYTPIRPESKKLKKQDANLVLELQATKDIAAKLGKMKTDRQRLVGFALETDNEEANATEKMTKKNFDFIVLNSLRDANAAFGCDTNKITIIDKNGGRQLFALKTKALVANDIIDKLEQML